MIKYRNEDCVVFCKTKDAFGGLSNMAGGFPIKIGDITVLTSEHLYQSFRFPDDIDIQKAIIDTKSPMAAKFISKKYVSKTRPDWNDIRVDVMRFCLDLKLLNNTQKFGDLLKSTDQKDIVELSKKDNFWGAIPYTENGVQYLYGTNTLGRLLWILNREIEVNMQYPKKLNLMFLGKNIEDFL